MREIFSKHKDWEKVLKILNTLSEAGYESYLAGGCVRDAALGVMPHDFDIATSAKPEDVEALFERTEKVGALFGVMLVILDKVPFEVATFRSEGDYQDGRHPGRIEFCGSKEDALRRDFTVNAMFYDIKRDEIVDYVDGLVDLDKKILRAVGDAEVRFQEDYLRMLRAIRFASQLGFEIEEKTLAAIQEKASLIQFVSRERIGQEIEKTLRGRKPILGFQLWIDSGLAPFLFEKPNSYLKENFKYLVDLTRAVGILESSEQAWAIFFAKWPDHLRDEQYRSFRLSTAVAQKAQFLLQTSRQLLNPKMRMAEKWVLMQGDLGVVALKFAQAFAEVEQHEGVVELVEQLMKAARLGELPKRLVNAQDLKLCGVEPGPRFGEILKEIYLLQLEGRLTNREDILDWITRNK